MRRGQAMVESMMAVIFVTFVLLFSIYIVRLLTSKILMDHAAARAARARAVGFNDFMCQKSARVAMIPVAGKRLLKMSDYQERYRIPHYLESENPAIAHGILDYEWWGNFSLNMLENADLAPYINATTRLNADSFSVGGAAGIESHYPLYMNQF